MTGRGLRFAGVDRASCLTVPTGANYTSPDGVVQRIFGLSALAFPPPASLLPPTTAASSTPEAVNDTAVVLRALVIGDRSFLLAADFHVDAATWALTGMTWTGRWDLELRSPSEAPRPLDAEGFGALPTGELFVSDEPGVIGALPPQREWPAAGPVIASVLARLPRDVAERILPNLGLESLAVVAMLAGGAVVVGSEGAISSDHSSVRRLLQFDASTGDLLCQKAVVVPEVVPRLYMTELTALDGDGLCAGGQFLALFRGWNSTFGNEIRLYAISAAGAEEVGGCSVIDEGAPVVEGACGLDDIVTVGTELIFRWTHDEPLVGHVPVDNYEGMALVPPAALGGRSVEELQGLPLMLINDNNDNERQLGTQFVFMRLKLDGADGDATNATTAEGPSAAVGGDAPPVVAEEGGFGTRTAAVALVAALALVLCLACAFWVLRRPRASQHFRAHGYRREALEGGGTSVDRGCAVGADDDPHGDAPVVLGRAGHAMEP